MNLPYVKIFGHVFYFLLLHFLLRLIILESWFALLAFKLPLKAKALRSNNYFQCYTDIVITFSQLHLCTPSTSLDITRKLGAALPRPIGSAIIQKYICIHLYDSTDVLHHRERN